MVSADNIRTIAHSRNRLERRAAYALVLVSIAAAIGWIESWTKAVAPKPDYYRTLFAELARQHYENTTTPTVVRKVAKTLEFFESQYDARNRFLGLPAGKVTAPESGLLSFSYVLPGVLDLKATSVETQFVLGNPTTNLARPGVALWLYSEQENVMACFACLPVDLVELSGHQRWPDRSNLLTIDWFETAAVEGPFPDGKLAPVQADLVELGDLGLKVENLDIHSKQDPELGALDYMLPIVNPPGKRGAPPKVSSAEAIEQLRLEAASGLLLTRLCFRWLLPLIGLLWIVRVLWGLRGRHSQCSLALEAMAGHARLSFLEFLHADLEQRVAEARADSMAEHYRLGTERREEEERRHLEDELRLYRQTLDLTTAQTPCIDEGLSGGSIEKLRDLAAIYRNIARQQRTRAVEQEQRARETEREIERLAREIEAIPIEKRNDEARECWSLYQRAIGIDDPREKVRRLKQARKKMPKHLRPERF
jgi:hypothetical protein